MSITFDTYLVRPLLLGGTGQVQTAVSVSGDTLKRIVVKLGAAPAPAWDDPTMATVEVPLGLTPGDGSMLYATFTKALATNAVVASWFAELETGGWVAGPVVTGIDLTCKYTAAFPWLKPSVIDLLRQAAVDSAPELQDGRSLSIRSAFPRDSHSLPCLSVQITAVPTGVQLVGDSDEGESQAGKIARKVRGYNITVDIISWTDNPEERDVIAPWLGGALSALVDTLPYFGAHEPTFSINESEDFDSLKVPVFLVTGSVNFTAFSDLTYPVPTSYGHLTLIQEVP